MKRTQLIMGMPITVEIVNAKSENLFDLVFNYFKEIDSKFSTYKRNSEISKINRGEIKPRDFSTEMRQVLKLCEETKKESNSYFDIKKKGLMDPSGLVKGWAIYNAARILKNKGCKNFYIDAGGDIQIQGRNAKGAVWSVGIKNPLKQDKIVKILKLSNKGVATSGTYIRGQHIYDPVSHKEQKEILSLTVIGPNVYEADRFVTAAFAMGAKGIYFIEKKRGLEGYMINRKGIATMTTGFERYII